MTKASPAKINTPREAAARRADAAPAQEIRRIQARPVSGVMTTFRLP
jgi:hypothetical protein